MDSECTLRIERLERDIKLLSTLLERSSKDVQMLAEAWKDHLKVLNTLGDNINNQSERIKTLEGRLVNDNRN